MIKKVYNKYPTSISYTSHILKFGIFGFKAVSSSRITEKQLDIIIKVLLNKLKNVTRGNKSCKIWNLTYLNQVLTKLSPESRMGKGKGSIKSRAGFIKPGTIVFEFSNISRLQILSIFKFIQKMVPFNLVLVSRF